MRKHKSDRWIGILTIALLVVGLVVIYAIGPMRVNVLNAYGAHYDENFFFWRQLTNVGISLAIFIAAFKIPYKFMRKFSKVLMLMGLMASAVLAVLALVGSGLAKCELGACRWYSFGGVSFQPAELLKIGLVMYFAGLMAERKKEGKINTTDFFWPFAVVSGLSLLFVVVIQKDLGTGVSLAAIIVAMLWMSGVKWQYFWLTVLVAGVLGIISIISSPHRMERIMTYGNSSAEDTEDNYHIENAMIAIGTGGLFGVGIGNSVQATGYLPESINDSVFAVMGETFGFFGLTAIVVAFAVLLMRLLKTASYLEDDEESLVVVGIFAWMMAHVAVNIMAMTDIIPLTGITLPLLSYGGTSMIFTTAALGLAMQLSCYTGRETREERSEA